MPTQYVDLNKLKFVAGRINPITHSELLVYSSAHSSERNRVYFNFRTCSDLGSLGARLAAEFVVWTASKERHSALALLVPIRAWMRHLSEVSKIEGSDPADWSREKWHLHTTEWWLSIRADPVLADTTKNQYRANVQSFIARMQTSGILPRFAFPGGIKKRLGGKKPSLATVKEAVKDGDDFLIHDEAVRAALFELDDLDDLTDSAQVLRRIDLLLGATRKAVDKRIRDFWFEWMEARRIVSSEMFDPVAFLQRHCLVRSPLKLRRGWRRELTDDTDIIALLEHAYDSIIPINEPGNPLVRLIYNEHSVGHIRDLLHSTPDTVIPFLVVMLLDQPIEVSYAAGLEVKSMTDTANPGNKRITYVKKRAGHRKITVIWAAGDDRALSRTSRRSIDPATAFRCVDEMRQPLVKFAEPHEADKLFLVLGNGGTKDTVKPLSASILIDAWDRFRSTDPVLSRYRFTLDKLRPTRILRTFIASGGNIFEAYHVAQHKLLRTTQRYVNEQVSEKLSASDARSVQDAISLKVSQSHPDLRRELRITEKDAERIVEKATNRGFLAYNEEPDAAREKVQSEIVSFFLTGEIIVIEDPHVAAELIVFKQHLVSELPTLRGQPDYEASWLPLLIFLNAALEAMLPDVLQRGHALAAEIRIEYLDTPNV